MHSLTKAPLSDLGLFREALNFFGKLWKLFWGLWEAFKASLSERKIESSFAFTHEGVSGGLREVLKTRLRGFGGSFEGFGTPSEDP